MYHITELVQMGGDMMWWKKVLTI